MSIVDLAVLILRLAVGLTFAAHGAQKAFGWWRGPGPEKWTQSIEGMGFRPAALFAVASIGAELGAGLLLALGLVTPLAAAVLLAQSIVIAVQVHLPKGFFSTQGGYEFAFVLGAASAAIALIGAGALSLDGALGLTFDELTRAAVILLGIVGGVVTLAIPPLARRRAQALRRA
ncbi:MAG TPA: DoxX family protein [Candidatus Limnocylindrales bacterium]|nr:DoxX family protein [Candidatus Limnocylindrales bacterium]